MSQAGFLDSSGGGGGNIQTLTGNTGGAVPPSANNINVIGDGTTITVTGNPGTSTLTISQTSGQNFPVTPVNTSPYVVLSTDYFLAVDCSGMAITIQLPNAPSTGRSIVVKDSTGSCATNNITVTTVGGAVNIDGATTYVMNVNYMSINVIFDASVYEVF